jgi:ribose transport system substrate-binding protein
MRRRRGSSRGVGARMMTAFAALAFVLAACGGNDVAEEDAPDADEVEEDAADDEAAGEEDEEAAGEEDGDDAAAGADDLCEGQDGEGRTVGFANLGESVPFAVLVREGIEQVAAECNLNIVNADNELSGEVALDNARNFVAQGVDGVIEFQVIGDVSGAVCEILEGLPVIAIDIAHPECAVFMGANNRVAGEINGEGTGQVVQEMWDCEVDRIITFEAFGVGQVNIDRLNGSIAGLQTVCPDNNYGDFEDWAPTHPDTILTRLDADRTDPAFEQGRDWLTANPDAEKIVALCINEDTCTGFHAAVQAAGRDGQVIFGSNGADPSAHDLIRDDPYYAGASAFFPERYGELLVPNIIRMMNGEDPTADPLLVEHLFINADNIDEWYPN